MHDCYYEKTLLPHEIDQEEVELRDAFAEAKLARMTRGFAWIHTNFYLQELRTGKTVSHADSKASFRTGLHMGAGMVCAWFMLISAVTGMFSVFVAALAMWLGANWTLIPLGFTEIRRRRMVKRQAKLLDEGCEGS